MITVQRKGKKRTKSGTQQCNPKYADYLSFRYASPSVSARKNLTKVNRVDIPGKIFR